MQQQVGRYRLIYQLLRQGPLEVTLEAPPAERAPTTVRREPAATPWYKRWWVWTIAGVVVAGATAAAVASTAGPDASKLSLGWEVKP
jgi:hypothetical protein